MHHSVSREAYLYELAHLFKLPRVDEAAPNFHITISAFGLMAYFLEGDSRRQSEKSSVTSRLRPSTVVDWRLARAMIPRRLRTARKCSGGIHESC